MVSGRRKLSNASGFITYGRATQPLLPPPYSPIYYASVCIKSRAIQTKSGTFVWRCFTVPCLNDVGLTLNCEKVVSSPVFQLWTASWKWFLRLCLLGERAAQQARAVTAPTAVFIYVCVCADWPWRANCPAGRLRSLQIAKLRSVCVLYCVVCVLFHHPCRFNVIKCVSIQYL